MRKSSEYGDRRGGFDSWFFLDQIERTLETADSKVPLSIKTLPYQAGGGHSLMVTMQPDGAHVYFDNSRLTPDFRAQSGQ